MIITKTLLTEILLEVTNEEIRHVAKDAHRKATRGLLVTFMVLRYLQKFYTIKMVYCKESVHVVIFPIDLAHIWKCVLYALHLTISANASHSKTKQNKTKK